MLNFAEWPIGLLYLIGIVIFAAGIIFMFYIALSESNIPVFIGVIVVVASAFFFALFIFEADSTTDYFYEIASIESEISSDNRQLYYHVTVEDGTTYKISAENLNLASDDLSSLVYLRVTMRDHPNFNGVREAVSYEIVAG